MLSLILITLVVCILIALILLKPRWIKYRRNKVKSKPFPKHWRDIIKRNVPYFFTMPTDLQLQLKQHILIFLDEKKFLGFEGIIIDDKIRVTIAAQACLLLLNRPSSFYPKLTTICVYPAAFITKHPDKDPAGVVHNRSRVLTGESWELGKVVLSWRDTLTGASIIDDGRNVVIHEFAHQLDQETGYANGAPFLRHKHRQCWSEVLSKEFNLLQKQSMQGEESLLNKYGATNPAEFFAVASETFFEQPKAMQTRHPQLYKQLHGLYQVDPINWI